MPQYILVSPNHPYNSHTAGLYYGTPWPGCNTCERAVATTTNIAPEAKTVIMRMIPICVQPHTRLQSRTNRVSSTNRFIQGREPPSLPPWRWGFSYSQPDPKM